MSTRPRVRFRLHWIRERQAGRPPALRCYPGLGRETEMRFVLFTARLPVTEQRSRGWMRTLARVSGTAAFVGTLALMLGAVGLAWSYRQNVVLNPGPHLEPAHIRSIIAQESPVFYRDGEQRVGVFFDAEHRETVSWEDLPQAWVMSIIAAEDQRFWSHPGVDAIGISRAMRDNIQAGTLVAGGSSLTQQTAKNLYYRPDRSVRSKLLELVNSLRLEAHYDKREILTFYANQFHVTGNGRGLGIGARHFFDKHVSELTVAESAFLAGLVKAPSRYDPFIGDEQSRVRAIERGRGRTAYVLQRLSAVDAQRLVPPPRGSDPGSQAEYAASLEEAQHVQDEAARALEQGIEFEFRRGTFRYDASAVLDEVARRLTEPPFDFILEQHGAEDLSTAGLEVVTTLDASAQQAAIYGLWHHLTEVGIQLEERGPSDLRLDGRPPRFDARAVPVQRQVRRAQVTAERDVDGRRTLDVDLGGHACHVDRDALVRIASAVVKGRAGSRSPRAQTADVDAVVEALVPESVVLVSVREVGPDGAVCDLEYRPTLQGAVMVQEAGEIRAMVGGNDNRNFNRATALRQMGSTWKPLVFHAAMTLGWRPDDPLDNRRNVFPFSTTFYYPRPDHDPQPVVSMSWAGVNSENLASIWLLYHLTDKLDGEQVRALAESLDLARRPDEDEMEYRLRIQKAGVLPTRARLEEGVFLQARQEVLAGAEALDHPEDELAISSLLLGWNYDEEASRVAGESSRIRVQRERALTNSWRHLVDRVTPCTLQYRALREAFRSREVPEAAQVEDLAVLLDNDTVRVSCGDIPEGYVKPDMAFLDEVFADDGVDRFAVRRGVRWLQDQLGMTPREALVEEGDIWVADRMHLSSLTAIDGAMKRRMLAHSLRTEDVDLYAPDFLYWHQDFRVLLALRYTASLAEQYGVQSEIPPVLSMPLGATDITLEEAVSVYGGLISGTSWSFPGDAAGQEVVSPPTPALLIAEIRDVDGNVLYQTEPTATSVADAQVADQTSHILRNVVRHGTGRRALAIREAGRQVPVGGKTGTTNEYRNAAFLGFAPSWNGAAFSSGDGYAVGVYVGYDDNRPLVQGGIRIAGSSGALPAWVETVQGMLDAGLLGEAEGELLEGDASLQWPLAMGYRLELLAVDGTTGLVLDEPTVDALEPSAPHVLVTRSEEEPDVDYRPIKRPPRLFPRTDAFEQR